MVGNHSLSYAILNKCVNMFYALPFRAGIMPDPLPRYQCDAYVLIGELGAGNFAYGDWIYVNDFWASEKNEDNCSAAMYCCNYNITAPDIPVHVEFASADEFNNATCRSEPCDICGPLEEKNGVVYLKNAVFCEKYVESIDESGKTISGSENQSSGETSSELSIMNSIVYTMQNACSAQDEIIICADANHESTGTTLGNQLTDINCYNQCNVLNSEDSVLLICDSLHSCPTYKSHAAEAY